MPITNEEENPSVAFSFRHCLSLVVCGLLAAPILLAQSKKPEDLGVGKLLVVPRQSPDPRFAESVVLIVRYAEDGTVGLMINRQTTLPTSEVLRDLKGSSNYSQPLYAGGPVQIELVQALLQAPAGPLDAAHVFGNVYLVSKKVALERALVAGKGSKGVRIYMGYCGWSRGQLENEVNLGGWYIFNASEGLVFDSNPSTLWSRMIARTELHIAQLQRQFDGRNPFGWSSSLTLSSSPKDLFPHREISQ